MTGRAWIIAAVLAAPTNTALGGEGGEGGTAWDARPRPPKGDYQVNVGTLSEMLPPTAKDKRVALIPGGR